MPNDDIWVIHTKKQILVTDDPGVPVAVCTSQAEVDADRAPGYFAGSFNDYTSRAAKVKELEEMHPDYFVDDVSIFW